MNTGRNILLRFVGSIGLTFLTYLFGYSQDKVISGTITASDLEEPLQGVNVILQGTTLGTVTDQNGFYELSIGEDADTLIFSFIGYVTYHRSIGNQSVIDVVLQEDQAILTEVVITALNLPRDKQSLGFATQEVKSENLRVARETNLNNALAGKVSGVQVIGGSAANFGQAAIRIRGVRGLEGEQPIYVLDGIVLTDPSSINMDNVSSVNVLKGANASALYGNRARDGVIVITSKTPEDNSLTIEFQNTTQFEQIADLPEYQNEYGGGYGLEFQKFQYDPNIHDPIYADSDQDPYTYMHWDQNWGPKLDGTPIRHWDSWYPNSPTFGELRPWVANPNNIRDFYETGFFINNSLSIGKAGENYMINTAFTNIHRKGVVPNTQQDRTFLNLTARLDLSDSWEVNTSINYGWTNTFGNLQMDWDNSIGANLSQWWHRQVDIHRLKELWQLSDGTYTTWNIYGPNSEGVPFTRTNFWDNPYARQYVNVQERTQEDFFGKFGLAWKPIQGLRVAANAYRSSQHRFRETRTATVKQWAPDGYTQWSEHRKEDNLEALVTYSNQFSEVWSLEALLGFNIRFNSGRSSSMATEDGLTVPELFSISASVDRPSVNESRYNKEVRSVFGRASLGYKSMLFIDATLRSDWTSALGINNNNYLYPSVSGSFVFSELLSSNDVLSFGKWRMSVAQVGSDLPPHQLLPTYLPAKTYQKGSFNAPVMFSPTILTDETIQPAVTTAYETGLELNMWQRRLSLDFSVFRYDNKDEIIPLSIAPSVGSSVTWINAGFTRSQGWEVTLGGIPINSPNFTWDLNFNFSQFNNEILDLYPGVENLVIADINRPLASVAYNVTANNRVREQWGSIIGAGFRRDSLGNKIVDAQGYYEESRGKILGHILPDFVGGIFSRMVYKNFELSFTIDWQSGGAMYSNTRQRVTMSGLGIETVGLNDLGNPVRDPVEPDGTGGYLSSSGGIIAEGVFENGEPNDVRLEAVNHRWNSRINELWLYEASYVKLRELRLAYRFPEKILSNIFLSQVRIALVANNPWLIYSAVPGMDPSELGTVDTNDLNASDKGAWFEEGQFPNLRSIGFDIKLNF